MLAAKDKERYQKESEVYFQKKKQFIFLFLFIFKLRDSEALKRQEEMRAKNNSLETDTRMRGTTVIKILFTIN